MSSLTLVRRIKARPSIVFDALTQSIAILEYLDERFPEPPLLPEDLRARARVRSLAALIISDTHPLSCRVSGTI